MKIRKLSFLLTVAACLLLAVSSFAQSETFKDANVEYVFDLPTENWKMTVKPSPTSMNVEYVYGERQSGILKFAN
jgi:hypothetical protein